MDTSENSFSGATPPPPSAPPPVIFPPAPARQPRKGRGWMVAAIILFVLLGFSVLFNIGSMFSQMGRVGGLSTHRVAGPRLEELVIEGNSAASKIAVVRIEGIISSQIDGGGFNMVDVVKAELRRAEEDSRVKAVILKVDSPGGEVLASDEIANAISDFQNDSGKPVVVSMGSLAASGGYYVSAPCRWIVANEMTLTGSIGVIMGTWNYRGLMDKVGVRPFTFKSGKFKDMLSGSREPSEITPEEIAMVQKLIDETYEKFKQVVAEGRENANQENGKDGKALASDWTDYADGRVLSGKEAHELGLVDELGNFDAAANRAKQIAGIKRANIVEYRQRVDLADLLGLFGKSESPAIKLDLGIEAPKIQAGRLYFLSPTYLH